MARCSWPADSEPEKARKSTIRTATLGPGHMIWVTLAMVHTRSCCRMAKCSSPAGVGDGVPVLLPSGKVLFVSLAPQLYDPATNSWSPASAMAAPHTGPAVLLPTGKVLVVAETATVTCAIANADAYDPATNSWSP